MVGIHQTMGSQDGSGQQSKFQPLARQSSLYNLTLDEVQNQLGDSGKPLGSMNLDELLKNVWTAESNQGMGMDVENVAPAAGDSISSASALQCQASMQLSRALSKKTVDEVWKDIQQGERENKEEKRHQERQPTLGEMTLEDFLVKAGVVAGASLEKKNVVPTIGVDLMAAPQQNFPEQAQWLPYQHPSVQEQQQQQQAQQPDQNMMGVFMPCRPVPQPMVVAATPLMDAMYPDNQMAMSSPLLGTFSDTQTPGRKRASSGDVLEKTVERRQKRMIKNRESAARSRARKQAYTNELENKVSRLEEENEKLKKQKELEKVLPFLPPSEPKYQLRRTSSAPF